MKESEHLSFCLSFIFSVLTILSVVLGIALALLVFLLVIVVHEFGHFITARLSGMKVLEFGFGIPPKATTLFTDKKGTKFTLNWLPLGGFVRIFGENPTGPDAFAPEAFLTKSLWKRLCVLVAGVAMNFLLAWIILSALFFSGARPLSIIPVDIGKTDSYFLPSFEEGVTRGLLQYDGIALTPLSGSIAQNAGIQAGDRLIAVDNQTFTSSQAFIQKIQENNPLTLTLERSGEHVNIPIVPQEGKIGMQVSYVNMQVLPPPEPQKFGILDSVSMGAHETYTMSLITGKLLKKTFGSLFFPKNNSEHVAAKKMLSGPIGIGNAFVMMVQNGVPLLVFFLFIALLSINLGILNILPFPALDGARMVTTCLYSIFARGEKGRARFLSFEAYFHASGFLLLLLFMCYIAFIDIGRLLP